MYIRKIGYVISARNADFHDACGESPDSRHYKVEKTGRILTQKEENAMQLAKNADTASIANQGFIYYQVISNNGACEQCQKHNGAIYLVSGAKEGNNLPPFHPNCKCTIFNWNRNGLAG